MFQSETGALTYASRRKIETFHTQQSFSLKHWLFQTEIRFLKLRFQFDTITIQKHPELM